MEPESNSGGNGSERLKRIEQVLIRIEEELSEIKEANVEHRVRLENGTKSFQDMHERLTRIEYDTAPKPVPTIKVAGITATLILALIGGLWGFAQQLYQRPTTADVDAKIKTHEIRYHNIR